jgi:pimeloyl-ACP methyl ester carboxylesterase
MAHKVSVRPVLFVGHSWGGSVITEAGNDPKVAGLVYVAAAAPEAGQTLVDMSQAAAPPLGANRVRFTISLSRYR